MKKTIKGFANLDYLTLIDVPVRKTSSGEVLDVSLSELERLAAIAILENRFSIKGAEVKLFRSVLDLSLAAFGEKLGYKDTTILNWEKDSKKRLSLVNEVAVKLLVGEHLGIALPASVAGLKGLEKTKNLRVSAA
jgi:DNA-binding transcriptional regulator YiaG